MQFDQLKRREFITLLGGAAAAWPLAARGQQSAVPTIGFLNSGSPDTEGDRIQAYRRGLSETGYAEGRSVTINYRWADGHNERLPVMAAELVRRGVSVIVTGGTPATLAAKAATTTIPIVFELSGDPVKLGLVASLNRPGGNITGISQLSEEALPKRLELLHELLPAAHVFALLVNPTDPAVAEPQTQRAQSVANTLGLELHVINAISEHDFDTVLAKLIELRASALVISGDALFSTHSTQLAALTANHAVPAAYQHRDFAAAGGLMSYGSSVTDTHRLAGMYAGRILKGDKPADLPVQQSTKVELFLNLKTAKALGITVPLPLSGRADEIFE